MKSSERSREWVKRLPEVVKALNNGVTRLTGKKPVDAISDSVVGAKSASAYATTYSRVVGLKEKRLDASVNVRYPFSAGELEGGKKRATDPNWSLKVYKIDRSILKKGEPVLYYLYLAPRVFLRVLRFSSLLKNQHFLIPIRTGIRGPRVCQSKTVMCYPR